MDVEVRHLRSLVSVVDTGTFTDAGIELGMSQAAVSRNVAALESVLGGATPAPHDAQRVPDPAGRTSAAPRPSRIGRRRRRAAGGTRGDECRQGRVRVVGAEKRYCAMSADDPLASKRTVTLAHVAAAAVAIDHRTGSTRLDLWPEDGQPHHTVSTTEVDDWLTVISSGKARGVTAESTAHQYRRQGLTYRAVRDAAPVPVYAAWMKADPPARLQNIITLLAGLYR